jgi:Homeodomain-like domain
MAMGRPKAALVLSPRQREQLEGMAHSRSLPVGPVMRVRIVLLSASGKTNQQIARQLGLANATVGKWRRGFLEQDVAGADTTNRRRSKELTFLSRALGFSWTPNCGENE